MNDKECCNNDCNQGRDCPQRKPLEFWKVWHNFLYSTNFTLAEWIVLVVGAALILMVSIR